MLRAFIGFDHIGKNLAEASWLPYCGYALTKYSTGKQLLITTDGWLSSAAGVSSGVPTESILDLSSYMVPGNNGISVGMRIKNITAGNTGNMLFVGTTTAGTDAQVVASFSHLPAGGETYMEATYNFATNLFTVFTDGVQIGQAAISTVNVANLKAGKLVLFLVHGSTGTSGLTNYRDIVVTDDIAGDGIVTRLGDRIVYPVTIDSATGTDWTASGGGSLLATLNVPIETVGAATITSGASKSPLITGLKPGAIPAGANIDGVALVTAGRTDVATALVGVNLSYNSKTVAAPSKVFGATLKYNNPVGVFARAPDGSRWTSSSIDATTLSLTPDVAS